MYDGDPLPEDFVCPICKHGASDFEKQEQIENKKMPEKSLSENSGNPSKKKYVCPICGYSIESEEKPDRCIICGAEMIEEVR